LTAALTTDTARQKGKPMMITPVATMEGRPLLFLTEKDKDQVIAWLEELRLPALNETETLGRNQIAQARFLHPFSTWQWYVVEYDPIPHLFFGYVKGFEGEWGYFTLDQLLEVAHASFPVVADTEFRPTKMAELLE
jgi:hypothetical protein